MQTDYSDMKPAVEGMLGDAEYNDIVSRISADDVPFGRGLVIAADGTVALPSAADEKFFGVAVQKQKATPNDTGLAQYDAGDDISVVTQGRIWVHCEQAVDPTDEVWVRTGDDYQGHSPGEFRTDDDNSSEPICLQVLNARWVNKTTAAGLALLELNKP